jgi:hypothetical protein
MSSSELAGDGCALATSLRAMDPLLAFGDLSAGISMVEVDSAAA